jgi:hypothetical protein
MTTMREWITGAEAVSSTTSDPGNLSPIPKPAGSGPNRCALKEILITDKERRLSEAPVPVAERCQVRGPPSCQKLGEDPLPRLRPDFGPPL